MNTISEVLAAVAAGQLTPEEASTLIDSLRTPTAVTRSDGERITEVFIKTGGARLIVIGDPTITEAVAEGIHRMERSNGTLLITTNQAQGDYSTTPPRSAFRSWLDSWMERAGQTLTVRVNPALPLRVLNVGGSLELTGMHGGASVGIEAGSATLDAGSGPLNLDVASGSAKVHWRFTGSSTIKADMGSASIHVLPSSDVVITAEASLGQATVQSPEAFYKTSGDESTPGLAVGNGAGRLHIAARMGSAKVTVG